MTLVAVQDELRTQSSPLRAFGRLGVRRSRGSGRFTLCSCTLGATPTRSATNWTGHETAHRLRSASAPDRGFRLCPAFGRRKGAHLLGGSSRFPPSAVTRSFPSRTRLGGVMWRYWCDDCAPSKGAKARAQARRHKRLVEEIQHEPIPAAMSNALGGQNAGEVSATQSPEEQSPRRYVPAPRRIVTLLTPGAWLLLPPLCFSLSASDGRSESCDLLSGTGERLRLALSILVFLCEVVKANFRVASGSLRTRPRWASLMERAAASIAAFAPSSFRRSGSRAMQSARETPMRVRRVPEG